MEHLVCTSNRFLTPEHLDWEVHLYGSEALHVTGPRKMICELLGPHDKHLFWVLNQYLVTSAEETAIGWWASWSDHGSAEGYALFSGPFCEEPGNEHGDLCPRLYGHKGLHSNN